MTNNNTYKHISDDSKYVAFDPSGTNYPQSATNVQKALELTSPTTNSSESKIGVLKIATLNEVLAGVDDTKAVTPFKLSKRLEHPAASTTVIGVLALATNVEALAGTNSIKAIVPSSLKYVVDSNFENRNSTESVFGTIKISSSSVAIAGTDDKTAMTPLKTKLAIANATSQIPSPSPASETTIGLVQLATLGQASQGSLRSGYAISPYTLNQLTGNTTRKGIVRAATQTEAYTGNDESLYISSKGFRNYVASTSNTGTVKLSEIVQSGVGLALSANAKVLPTTGGTITGVLTVNGSINLNGSEVSSKKHVVDSIPVGSVQMWLGSNAPVGGLWALCDGGAESKNNRPDLFAVIGYKFGGSGDLFYRPDMRGLFVRGAGVGKDISNEQGLDGKNKPKLGVGVSGAGVGVVQKQQCKTHKHVIPWGDEYRGNWTSYSGGYGATSTNNYLGFGRNSKSYTDWGNFRAFSNDGGEIEASKIRDENGTLNSDELMGNENRPWNMSVNYIIKVA